MAEPLISIVVPIYMIDRYVGICIESLIHQTYRNLEIILVDDGSKDRCPEICDLYARKDSRIKVIHQPNGGLVAARKAGVLAATGTYVGYVDGDDWVGPGFYHSLYSSIAESGADIAIAGFSRDLFRQTKQILNAIPSGTYEGASLEQLYGRMISYGEFYRHGVTTYLWNKLFRRELILPCQLAVDNRITVGEDAAVVYPALLKAKKVCITDNCAYHYRQREDSMLKVAGDFAQEAARLHVLYDYMAGIARQAPVAYHLPGQVDDFMLSTYVIRSGARMKTNQSALSTFPFACDLQDKRIVLFGAGTFGQQLYKHLEKEKGCKVVGWIDPDYWEYRRCCMDVDPIESIVHWAYDYVLMAGFDREHLEQTRQLLADYGVAERQIMMMAPPPSLRAIALEEYLAMA